jgi:RNA polymerase sigma factor (sigma-70 family)
VNEAGALVLKATDSNATLIERHEAFGGLVRAFQDMAYACAHAVLGDFHLAEDAAQEAFITAWQKLHQLRQPEAFPGWLRRIVLTECNRLTRGSRLGTQPLDVSSDVASVEAGQQSAVECDELLRAVTTAVKSLPQNERMVAMLFYMGEHSQRDISEFLEVPTTTVAKRLYNARARLRDTLMGAFRVELAEHLPSRSDTFSSKVRRGIFDTFVGQYRFELRPDLVVTVRRERDKLFAEAAGQTNELWARGESENQLFAREFDGMGEFVLDEQGQISGFVYHEFGREMGLARKIS